MTRSAWSRPAAALAAVPGCTESACCSGAVNGAASIARSAGRSIWQRCSQDWLIQLLRGKPSKPCAACSILCGNNTALSVPAARLHILSPSQALLPGLDGHTCQWHGRTAPRPGLHMGQKCFARAFKVQAGQMACYLPLSTRCSPSAFGGSRLSTAFMAGCLAPVPPAARFATTAAPSLLLQTPQPH